MKSSWLFVFALLFLTTYGLYGDMGDDPLPLSCECTEEQIKIIHEIYEMVALYFVQNQYAVGNLTALYKQSMMELEQAPDYNRSVGESKWYTETAEANVTVSQTQVKISIPINTFIKQTFHPTIS